LTRNKVATFATLIAAAAIAALPATSVAEDVAEDNAEDNERGEALFDLCQQCHGESGQGMQMALAPAIGGLDQWYIEAQLKMFKSGARGMNPGDVGGMRMYPMSLWLRTDEDVKAVAGYVANLPATHPTPVVEGGDAAKGKEHYQVCATCHGPDGKGNQSMNSPPLVGMSDWYLLSQLEKYKAGVLGSNQKNPNSMLMRGMAMSLLTDDQAVKDVIAHITTMGH
jgi:cytochrome c553